MIKLYRHPLSGNSHRAELLLSLLKLDYELVDVDLLNGEQAQAEFLARNPFGQVPVLEDGSVTINESNAILIYLAKKYGNEAWLPEDPAEVAEVQRWLSITASKIQEGPAAARLVTVFNAPYDHEERKGRAHDLLKVVDQHLSDRKFLLGENVSLADVAAYAYIAHAPEGGVSLEDYPTVRAWLANVEALEGFVGMRKTKVALAA